MDNEASQFSLQRSGALEPIKFVCWRWTPPTGYRSKFEPKTIAILHSMIARNYKGPFEMICVTDQPREVPAGVTAIQLWDDWAKLPSPHGRGYPSCYRRLKMFSAELAHVFGPRFVSIDLDVVITGDITKLFSIDKDFKMYGDTARGTPYNGSLIYNRVGTRSQLWDKFDPLTSPRRGRQLGFIGSDQAWIGACLGPKEPKFTASDGVYSYRNELLPRGGHLPQLAKIVVFHGHYDPWTPYIQLKHPWVKQHYK